MVKRQVFFSFEYGKDNWRAAQVRNMGKVSNNSTFSENDWEEVKEKDDKKIKKWIDEQLEKRSCLVVLIGNSTANRKWINYEIKKAYELNKGILGINIHGLKNKDGKQSSKGSNPFYYVKANNGDRLSKHITRFDSSYTRSTFIYSDIENNLEQLIDDAIENKPPR